MRRTLPQAGTAKADSRDIPRRPRRAFIALSVALFFFACPCPPEAPWSVMSLAAAAEPEEPARLGPPAANAVRIEEGDQVRIDYTGEWSDTEAAHDWSGGAAVVARKAASLTFSFTGTRVSWISSREASAGIARVYLDGKLIGKADLYSETPIVPARVFTSKDLEPGPHTLTIEATGKAARAATDTRVVVDAFDVTGGAPHATVYTLIDLGTLGGGASAAADINNRGEIVGWSTTAGGERRAFLYRNGEMTGLGTLAGGSYSEATAIGDNGQVAGFGGINAYGPNFREYMMAFVWVDGTFNNLPGLHCHCDFNKRYPVSIAYDVNNARQAVGWSPGPRGEWIPYATLWRFDPEYDYIGWRSEPVRPPDADAGQWEVSRAFAINDFGQIVGDYAPNAGREGIKERRPFLFLWKQKTRRELERLPGHVAGTPLDIDWAGRAAGWSGSVDAAESRAVLWRDGAVQDLGVLSGDTHSQALGINASGQVVGWSGSAVKIEITHAQRRRDAVNPGASEISDASTARAFLWRNNEMIDLNALTLHGEDGKETAASDWLLAEATAINDAGQIVGTGFHKGRMRAYLLTPHD